MKKALIAAAVAGAFAAPYAMAADGPSVNIYMAESLTFGDTTTTNGNTVTKQDTDRVQDGGGNRLMFSWTDTLNNGMTLHVYQSFGNLSNSEGVFGGNNVRNRNTHIGLSGDFGAIRMGTNEHFIEGDAIIDGYGADWGSGGEGLNHMTLGNSGFAFVRRDSNSVWWNSNDYNGLTFRAAYIGGPAPAAANASDPEGMQLGVKYASGAFSVGYNVGTYDDYGADGGNGTAGVAGSEVEANQFNAAYDFGSFALKATMIDMEQTNQAGAGTGLAARGYSINVTMPVSGGRVIANIGSISDQDQTVAGVTTALNDSGRESFDIGYQHDFSANTYGFVRYDSREDGVNFDATAGRRGKASLPTAGGTQQ